MARVRIIDGPGSGQNYDIEQAVILGRLDSNDIPVRDAKASREHAKIYRQGDKFSVVDLNSSNGTFVNGKQITKQVLEHGDEVSIGVVVMRFEDDEAEARKAAAPQRQSLEEAFEAAKKEGAPAAAGAGGGGTPEIVMSGHKPLQFNRVKPGKPMVGFDLEQLSPTARFVVWLVIGVIFVGLLYGTYTLVSG
ncbi:MAG: FHA domain-containing protein [Planctomycetota bacterium]